MSADHSARAVGIAAMPMLGQGSGCTWLAPVMAVLCQIYQLLPRVQWKHPSLLSSLPSFFPSFLPWPDIMPMWVLRHY